MIRLHRSGLDPRRLNRCFRDERRASGPLPDTVQIEDLRLQHLRSAEGNTVRSARARDLPRSEFLRDRPHIRSSTQLVEHEIAVPDNARGRLLKCGDATSSCPTAYIFWACRNCCRHTQRAACRADRLIGFASLPRRDAPVLQLAANRRAQTRDVLFRTSQGLVLQNRHRGASSMSRTRR